MALYIQFQIYRLKMQKKQNLKKIKSSQTSQNCMICRIAKIPFLITISSVILLQKYYHPLEKSTFAALTYSLTKNKHTPGRTQNHYKDIKIIANGRENLLAYYNFNAIISKIKPVVLECLKRDTLMPMHYHEHTHLIMLKHSLLKRRMAPSYNRIYLAKKENTNESTDQQQRSQPRKVDLKTKGNQTASMRRLTRNLSSMVRRFEDQNDFHSSFILQLMNYASKHAVEEQLHLHEEIWRRELQENSISEIMKMKGNKRYGQVQRLPTNPQPQSKKLLIVQENYGFQPQQRKLINEQYKQQKRKMISPNMCNKMKENIPYRVQTDYDCQIIKKTKKKSSVSSKKQLLFQKQKNRKFISSNSKKKDNKLYSAAKSRVK